MLVSSAEVPVPQDILPSPLPAVAPSSVASTTPNVDHKAIVRERTRQRLDEIHANLERERLAKAAAVAPSHHPPAPLIANPRRDPIPEFLLVPRGRNRKIEQGVGSQHENTATPPGIGLSEVDSSKQCPCGQVFSRRDHVTRHRARNICSAGYLYPGEPKRVAAAKAATAKTQDHVVEPAISVTREASVSSSQIDAATLPLNLDDDTSSLTSDDDSKAGSDYGTKPKPKPTLSTGGGGRGKVTYHHCSCGLSFNHIGNFNRHRKAKKCSAVPSLGSSNQAPRAETPVQSTAPTVPANIPPDRILHDRPLARKEFPAKEATVCACGKVYTRNDSLVRHLLTRICPYGIGVLKSPSKPRSVATPAPVSGGVGPKKESPTPRALSSVPASFPNEAGTINSSSDTSFTEGSSSPHHSTVFASSPKRRTRTIAEMSDGEESPNKDDNLIIVNGNKKRRVSPSSASVLSTSTLDVESTSKPGLPSTNTIIKLKIRGSSAEPAVTLTPASTLSPATTSTLTSNRSKQKSRSKHSKSSSDTSTLGGRGDASDAESEDETLIDTNGFPVAQAGDMDIDIP